VRELPVGRDHDRHRRRIHLREAQVVDMRGRRDRSAAWVPGAAAGGPARCRESGARPPILCATTPVARHEVEATTASKRRCASRICACAPAAGLASAAARAGARAPIRWCEAYFLRDRFQYRPAPPRCARAALRSSSVHRCACARPQRRDRAPAPSACAPRTGLQHFACARAPRGLPRPRAPTSARVLRSWRRGRRARRRTPRRAGPAAKRPLRRKPPGSTRCRPARACGHRRPTRHR
jgi:hypothetical protein